MGIYLGSSAVNRIYLGTSAVKKVYLGTDLVFEAAGADVLFDNGWVSGISWSGNALPREQYTSVATYSFGYVDSEGYMRLTVNSASSYSNVQHNCHVCTSGLITVPAGATKMLVNVRATASTSPEIYFKFGLVTQDCVAATDATNGGQLSAWLSPSTTATNYEITLDNGIAGNQFIAVVNARRTAQASAARSLEIYKVWFE